MKTSSPIPGSFGGNTRTLAQSLAAGTLPLATAMQVATDVSAALRELHEHGRTHGRIVATNVLVGPKGAELLPSRAAWDLGDTSRDTREFGALLYHMLTGGALRAGEVPAAPRRPGDRSSAAGLRASALQVAADCFKEDALQPTMQQVATELRLLAVILKMPDKGEEAEPHRPSPPPTPFLVEPVHFPLKKRSGGPAAKVPVRPAAQPAAAPTVPALPPPVSGPAAPPEDGKAPVVPRGPAAFGQPSVKPPAEVCQRGGECPKCHSAPVYVSRARSQFEQWLTRMKVPICRCHSCYHRYFVFSRFRIAKEMPVGSTRKKRPHRRKR